MATEHQQNKVEKTLHEFKEGTLHSGSKKGPEVHSKKQAIAIALNQAGLSKYDEGGKVSMTSANPFDKITAGDKAAPKPPKHIREIVTRKSHDGKFIHTHKHWHPEHHPDEEHVSTDMAGVHSHAEDHMGTPNMGEETPAGQGPAPLMASAPAMPAGPAA